MGPFLHIRSTRFPVLPGEDAELVNEGMYGKALAEYLNEHLSARGYQTLGLCCEDWGWWIGLSGFPFPFGVCIYGQKGDDGQLDLSITDGATPCLRWSWRQLRFVDNGARAAAAELHGHLVAIVRADPEVCVLATNLDTPFVR